MKIALIMPPHSQYGTMFHYTQKLYEALEYQGVDCSLIEGNTLETPHKLMEIIHQISPHFTLSFNGLLPDSSGHFLADALKIPHIALLIDSPARFLPLFKSQYTCITCADLDLCEFVRSHNFNRVHFLPAAVEKDIELPQRNPRPYDIVMLSSCIDYESIHDQWQKRYPPALIDALEEAAEATLATPALSYIQALHDSVNKREIDPFDLLYPILYRELEDYMRGKDRVALLRAIKNQKVHLFGKSLHKKGWDYYLKDSASDIEIHDPVPFSQALEIMGQTKILLNSCPSYKQGLHTRMLAGVGVGALPVTNRTAYLEKEFIENQEIAFYDYSSIQNINTILQNYLDDEDKRSVVASRCRDKILQHHTWDHRALDLIKFASSIVVKGVK